MVKRIFITAPEAYQPRFVDAFRRSGSQGINPVFMPFICTIPMLDSAELQVGKVWYRVFHNRQKDNSHRQGPGSRQEYASCRTCHAGCRAKYDGYC